MPKTIAILTDGTGNSSGKLFKTNVWRLYQALDLAPLTPQQAVAGSVEQIAYYHDGVGTSSFKPLAIIGGVFGWGLKRNVIDAYSNLCRTYEENDRIFFFGFSRGAFTARILNGLVLNQGLLRCSSENELARSARDAYRAYRRCFIQTGGLVTPLRNLRDRMIGISRRIWHQRSYSEIDKLHPESIAFIGVWDTVSAYGLPIDVLTRGIDDWVWPLSMPNYKLSPQVECARHALSLDDERNTFHPLLWDEINSEAPDHLQQVWFAGVHSDVGGGYPDDALAQVPLAWMMQEAEAVGLRFKPQAIAEVERAISQSAPMHDSRHGLGGYYRYQPRNIDAFIEPPDPTTRSMRDPDLEDCGLLRRVKIHRSVFDRIKSSPDHYAPIVLPKQFDVVGSNGAILPSPLVNPAVRVAGRDQVWDLVWHKQAYYLLTVAASLFLAILPLFNQTPSACEGPQCVLAPMIIGIGGFLPNFLQFWIDGFARNPGLFAVAVVVLALLLSRSAQLQRLIHDQMRALWDQALSAMPADVAVSSAGEASVLPAQPARPENWVRRLRCSRKYQRFLQLARWRIVPTGFGVTILVIGPLLVIALGTIAYHRFDLALAERSARLCPSGPKPPMVHGSMEAAGEFATSSLCWPTNLGVEKEGRYLVTLTVGQPWLDNYEIFTSPAGFGSEQFRWYARYGAGLLARSLTGRWFQPFIKIVPEDGPSYSQALEMRISGLGTYSAEFTAKETGALFLFVNDAIVSWRGLTEEYYSNNSGTAKVTLTGL